MQMEGMELNDLTTTHFRHFHFQSFIKPHYYEYLCIHCITSPPPEVSSRNCVGWCASLILLSVVHKSHHLGSVSSFEKLLVQTPPKRLLCLLGKLYMRALLRVHSAGASEVCLLLCFLLLSRVSMVTHQLLPCGFIFSGSMNPSICSATQIMFT